MKAHHDWFRFPLCWRLGAVALALVPLSGFGATFQKGTVPVATTAGNTVTYTTGVLTGGGAMNNAGMTPVPVNSTITVPPGWAVGHPAGGATEMKTRVPGPVPGVPSKTVPVDVTAKLNKQAVGRAIVNTAQKLGPLSSALTLGLGVYMLLRELGITPSWSNGQQTYTKDGEGGWLCLTSKGGTNPPMSDARASCSASFDAQRARGYWPAESSVQCSATPQEYVPWTTSICTGHMPDGTTFTVHATTTPREGGGTAPAPMTAQQVADEIANRGGNSTNIDQAVRDAIEAGEKIEIDRITVTGPSTQPGPTTTKETQTPTGTKTETTTSTINITYGGNQYTTNITNNTTTNTTNNTTNETTTETTTEEKETPEEKDPCKLHPNSLGCSELDEPEDGEIPKKDANVTFTPDNISLGGGACPGPFGWQDSLGSHQIVLTPLCDILSTVVKPLVIAFAALAAALIMLEGTKQ